MTTVVVVDEAEDQLRIIDRWWRENRPLAPKLVLEEFSRCVSLLETAPDIGPRFRRSSVLGVRRLVMKRTKHIVFYVHDRANAIVHVIAVWGAPKEGTPILRDFEPFSAADVVFLESTYGDRDHQPFANTLLEFINILKFPVNARH